MFVMFNSTGRKQAKFFFVGNIASFFLKKVSVQQPLRCYWKDLSKCTTSAGRPEAA